MEQSCLPTEWKNANVVPIFKKNDRSCLLNYHPVSLTSICCKLLEHIIYSNIFEHLDKYNILCSHQHGFRTGHSCETQLLTTLDDLAYNLNSGFQTDLVLLDFKKAFDKVLHHRLCYKLTYYGIKGTTLRWIQDFLTNRIQQVVVNGCSSIPSQVISGVPQGSVLGLLLFICYINDLPKEVNSTVKLYADDVLLYRAIHSIADHDMLQKDLINGRKAGK